MRLNSRTLVAFAVFVSLLLTVSTEVMAKPTGFENIPEAKPAWMLRFKSPVLWQRATPLGHLLVNTATGLYGIEPDSGKVVWSHSDMGDLPEEQYEVIAGTPFVAVSDDSEDARMVILDPIDGGLVFDSRKAGLSKVLSSHFLNGNRNLLIVGLQRGVLSTSMFMFDVASGEKLWVNEDLLGNASRLAKAFTALFQATTGESGIRTEPLEVGGGSFLIASATHIYRIDMKAGKILWQIKNLGEQETGIFLPPDNEELFYVGSSASTSLNQSEEVVYTYYTAHRLEDGSDVWPEPVRLKGDLNDVIFTDEGLIVSPRTSGKGWIKLIDYASGRSLWGKKGKGIKIVGGIVDHDFSDSGLVLTTGYDSAWTDKGTVYSLNILDVGAGTFRFEKSIETEGRIRTTEVLPKGLLYVTTSEVGIIDPRSGEPVSKTRVASKDSLVTATRGQSLFAFSTEQGKMFRIDKMRATIEEVTKERITLEDKEIPFSLEVNGDGLMVISSQNLVAVGQDGRVKFHAYYPPPRHSALLRALLTAQAIRAGMASVASGVTGAAFASAASQQQEGSLARTVSTSMAQGYGEMAEGYAGLAGRYASVARARFKASATTPEFVFMMVKVTGSNYALAKVSKRTGAIEELIHLKKDKTPSYEVDTISNQIYYRLNPNEVVCYKF